MEKIFGQLTSPPPPPPPKRNWSRTPMASPQRKQLEITHNIAGVNCRYLQISGMSYFFLWQLSSTPTRQLNAKE